MVMNKTQ